RATVPSNRMFGLRGFTNKISRSNRREHVRNLQLVRERTWQPRGGSRGLSVNQRLLERLEAENAVLRSSVVELVLQIQALRDALGHPQSEIQPPMFFRPLGLGPELVGRAVGDGRADKALGARFRFTVQNFPIARTARYGIATLS